MVIIIVLIASDLIEQLKKLAEHEELCNNNDFCLVKMPEEKNKFISSTPVKIH